MRSVISSAVIFLATVLPAVARDRPDVILALPEPGSMALLGVAAVGLMIARRKKK